MNQAEKFNRVVLVGVDIQNDFCPGGNLAVAEGDQVVKPFNQVAEWVREHKGIVALTRDWHPTETNHFGNPPDFSETWPVHCVAETKGADFHPDLDVEDGDPIFSKGTKVDESAYSGFEGATHSGMTLETLLKPIHHERVAVIIGGLATDYCVKATVLDALRFKETLRREDEEENLPARYLGVFALADAMKGVDPETELNALEDMALAGAAFVNSEDIIEGGVIALEDIKI